MNKVICCCAVAILVSGCSGSGNGTSTSSSTTGLTLAAIGATGSNGSTATVAGSASGSNGTLTSSTGAAGTNAVGSNGSTATPSTASAVTGAASNSTGTGATTSTVGSTATAARSTAAAVGSGGRGVAAGGSTAAVNTSSGAGNVSSGSTGLATFGGNSTTGTAAAGTTGAGTTGAAATGSKSGSKGTSGAKGSSGKASGATGAGTTGSTGGAGTTTGGACGSVTEAGDCNGATLEYCGQNADGGPGLVVSDCTQAFPSGEVGACQVIDQFAGANCVAPLGGACLFVDGSGNEFAVFCAGTGSGCIESATAEATCKSDLGNCTVFEDGGALLANPPTGAPCLGSDTFLQCNDNQVIGLDCSSFGDGSCDSTQSSATFGECLVPVGQPCDGQIVSCVSGATCPAAFPDGGEFCEATTGTTGTTGSTGTSGSTGGTTGGATNTLTGTGSFKVGKAIDALLVFPDGGVDPTFAEIDITNDKTDTCINQEGYPDGGLPKTLTEEVVVRVLDPNGVEINNAYPSLTANQWKNLIADGGLPSTAFAEVILESTTAVSLSVSGTVTLAQDSTTQEVDGNFSVDIQALNAAQTGFTGAATAFSGNGTPPASCTVGFEE